MNDNIRIRVRGLVKYFYFFEKDYTIIKWLFTKMGFTKEFQVLNGLNFDIHDGEVVGILGANGAGKSTLLKIISGVYNPTCGSVQVNGKVSSLLELGAGFNPLLSGKENIYFKGKLLGLSKKEIDEKIDDIIEFADIGEYIDMPISSYSSGMNARLGFALAVHVDPDILIVDEVFAVGDRDFQQKSKQKTIEFFEKGKTVLFVSHSESLIRDFCTRVLYLQNGFIQYDGEVNAGIDYYHESLRNTVKQVGMIIQNISHECGLLEMIFDIGFIYQNHVIKPIPLEELEIIVSKFSKERNCTHEDGFIDAHYEIIDENSIKVVLHNSDIINVGDFTLGFIESKSNYKGESFNYTVEDICCYNEFETSVDNVGGKLLINSRKKYGDSNIDF